MSGIEKSVDERLEALEKLVEQLIDEQAARDKRLGRIGKVVMGAATVLGILVGSLVDVIDRIRP